MATTNTVAASAETMQAPLNQIVTFQVIHPPITRSTAPNADTLYMFRFINVTKEPMVFSYPNMGTRYFLFPIKEAWTDVIAAPGKRTEGDAAHNVLITGPESARYRAGWDDTPQVTIGIVIHDRARVLYGNPGGFGCSARIAGEVPARTA